MNAPDSVLVTGAGGFVGSALAEGFAALGWQVTAVDREFDEVTRERLHGCDLVRADLGVAAPGDLPAASHVIHAAATTTEPSELGWTSAAHIAANTRPLLAMLEHAARTRPAAFVFLSSSGVFAASDGHGVLTDDDIPGGTTPYAVAKRAAELLTMNALGRGIAAHVLRLGYLYGPHETTRPSRSRLSPVARWLAAARDGVRLEVTDDDPARDWTFTPDLAPVLAKLMKRGSAECPMHVCSPYVVKDSAMAQRIVSLVPGASYGMRPAAAPTKPPMRASNLSYLGYLRWTSPDEALARLVATEVAG